LPYLHIKQPTIPDRVPLLSTPQNHQITNTNPANPHPPHKFQLSKHQSPAKTLCPDFKQTSRKEKKDQEEHGQREEQRWEKEKKKRCRRSSSNPSPCSKSRAAAAAIATAAMIFDPKPRAPLLP
jgi:hypothetical protein